MPPVIVNVPASGPPWWATALVAFASALLGVLVTAYIARAREHRKWIWEKQFETCVDLVRAVHGVLALVLPVKRNGAKHLELLPRGDLWDAAHELADPRLQILSVIPYELRRDVNNIGIEFGTFRQAWGGDEDALNHLSSTVQEIIELSERVEEQVNLAVRKPPPIGLIRSLRAR